jgi:hypothetical protein
MTPDLINGIFEGIGAIFTWANAMRVVRDRGYAGIYLPAVVFFTSWGIWNLAYYPHLGQWFSLAGAYALVAGNACWIAAMLKFGRKQ